MLITVKPTFPRFMIHPNSKTANAWSIILTLLLIYTATIMPYRMAFMETEMWTAWFWVELIIDALFFVDFCVNCNSAYYA